MRRIPRWLPLPVSLAVLLGGCAARTGQLSPSGGKDNQARAAVYGLVADYENNDAEGFIARFDEDSFPDFLTFRESVRGFLLRNRQFNISIIIDAVLEEGDKVAVQARWRRGFVDQTGIPKKDSGRCEFLFRRRASGGLVVTAIRKESPF